MIHTEDATFNLNEALQSLVLSEKAICIPATT